MAVIGIMDSGVGGLSVYREIFKLLPHEKYVYYSDNAYCPYGPKGAEFIQRRATAVAQILLDKGSDVIVVACNTATAAAIELLRSTFPVPFVGMEPAVKPAAAATRSGVVGVLATKGTLSASKYHDTKETYGSGIKVVEHVGEGFVELVESGAGLDPHNKAAIETVRASVQPLLEEGADTIVLGCTHYPFLIDFIREVAGPEVQIIDPAPAVARQTVHVLKEHGIPFSQAPADGTPADIELLASGPRDSLERIFSRL